MDSHDLPPHVGNVDPRENSILGALPESDYQLLLPYLESFSLKRQETVHHRGVTMSWVYFPVNAAVALELTMPDGEVALAGLVGRDGVVGASLLLGDDLSPTKASARIPGQAIRIRHDAFKAAAQRSQSLHTLTIGYVKSLWLQAAQSLACTTFHPASQRVCRFLLMVRDSVGCNRFAATQNAIADMLGVRRPTVTVVAGELQKAGVISYSRGTMTILDSARLEALACDCYRATAHRH